MLLDVGFRRRPIAFGHFTHGYLRCFPEERRGTSESIDLSRQPAVGGLEISSNPMGIIAGLVRVISNAALPAP